MQSIFKLSKDKCCNTIKSCFQMAWIGLYDDVNSWRWSHRDAEVEFTNWYPGEPNNQWSREHCTMMYRNGEWNDESCNTRLQSVCSYVTGESLSLVFSIFFLQLLLSFVQIWAEIVSSISVIPAFISRCEAES